MKKTTCIILAILTIFSLSLYGCGGSLSGDSSLDYAKTKVEDYLTWQTKYNAEFYDEVYAKAYMAAISYNSKRTAEELESIARYLFVDSITVTDSEGKVVADYPETNKGKNIGDIDGLVKFKSILKWVCPKCATDIVKDEETDEYAMTLGVQRSDDGGCVIVSLKTDSYAKVDGSDLAEQCGGNVIVAKDKEVISSTLDGVEAGQTFKELNISDNDLKANDFILTAGKNSYTCKAADVENFTVVVKQ
ncbi:MAG: cache domain-containing protein [Ruminococcus sp.]|nr:cache domain-containing protein [Ruminococcus sp.]